MQLFNIMAILETTSLLRGLFAVAAIATASSAQTGLAGGLKREFETRAELEAQAKAAEAQHRTSEAWLLKTRLEKGDFQEGDRIVVSWRNAPGTLPPGPDTVMVRAGKVIQFPRMADFSLEGVLRSELTERLTAHLSKYVIEPIIRATPLLRLALFGEIGKPGFLYQPADILLTDVIMNAGGPTSAADLNNVVIRRGSDIIWTQQDVRTALSDGLSLDRLHLRAGDEIVVGRRSEHSVMGTLQFVSTIVFSVIGLIALSRR